MINKLAHYNSILEDRINQVLPDEEYPYNKVLKAARYSLMMGGKRIRPAIMFEFCKLCGGNESDCLDFAVALEMIHTYSLIHDDLPCMDNDDLRRGKPSCHKVFGEDIALLAGDTLLTEAFRIAANAELKPEITVKAISILSSCAGLHGMIGGQVLDLSFEENNPDEFELIDMYSRKTSNLLIAAAVLGCFAAGKTDEATIRNSTSYARDLGIAFQIIDDILDVKSTPEELGKPIGSDDRNGKTTFVKIHGIESSFKKAKFFTNNSIESLNEFTGDKTEILKLTDFLLDRKK